MQCAHVTTMTELFINKITFKNRKEQPHESRDRLGYAFLTMINSKRESFLELAIKVCCYLFTVNIVCAV